MKELNTNEVSAVSGAARGSIGSEYQLSDTGAMYIRADLLVNGKAPAGIPYVDAPVYDFGPPFVSNDFSYVRLGTVNGQFF